ncbi:MAG: type IX secretion system protein PorQ [Bacteroidetes bacterium]|nr:type IX secretion system protein PorQ [Bacteroidota bacterium]
MKIQVKNLQQSCTFRPRMKAVSAYLLWVWIALASLTNFTSAQIGGSFSYAFLQLPPSARIEALGGTQVAIMDNDPGMAFQNPALLNRQMHLQAAIDINAYFANIGYGSFALAHRFKSKGTVFGGIQYFDYGSFTETLENGQIIGEVRANDQALYLGYSQPIVDSTLFVGGHFKAIFSAYAGFTSIGAAVDLGLAYRSKNKRTVMGLVFKNMGSMIDPYTTNNFEPIPFQIQLGFSHQLEHLPLRLMITANNLQRPDLSFLDIENPISIDPLTNDTSFNRISLGDNILRHFILGAELMPFKQRLFFRISYNFLRGGELSSLQSDAAAGLSWGFGIRISHFTFSYSRATYHAVGSPNHLTLQINAGKLFAKKKQAATDVPRTGI